jgi:TetR/AcrR family transcriptional regulator, transcriptional repressor of bet genes
MPGRKVPEEARREDILRAAYDVAARLGVEALTLRAVAERAAVSHGTVLFHFERRDQLVTTLLDRVLYATSELRVPDSVGHLTRPIDRLLELLRVEMGRLASEPRHFRLFLEYWSLGVRSAGIRRKVGAALESYRAGFREFAGAAVQAKKETGARRGSASDASTPATAAGLAAVAVSLIHGCALQAVIDPRRFDVEHHFAAAAGMLERLI